MKKYTLLQKVMALTLTLVMVIGLMPNFTLPATAAEQAALSVTGKVADPETLNNWQDYYGDQSLLPDGGRGISTWKAGGVWTDKSVFSTDQELTAAGFPSGVALDDTNDFIVSLSALASNQEIVGQSTTPTDTMLVLDLSQSMDNSGSVDDMIAAANETIDTLLKMNVNNRVGVVLYSGNTDTSNPGYTSSATVILPLDRYTTTTSTTDWEQVNGQWTQVTKYEYLSVSGSSDTTVSVAGGTRNSNNSRPTGSKNTNGGTYIQNGLFQAWEEFESKTDKGVVQSGAQTGTQRQPILILMSDGRPTLATEDYNDVGTSESSYGNGSNNSTSWETVFLTQLTAAWVKGAVKDHYNNTAAKFYTLGLGTGNDTYATGVLNPGGVTESDVLDWWTNFQNGTNQNGSVRVEDNWGNSNDWYLPYDEDRFATGVGKNYVDQHWSANDVAGMIAAFKQIVEEIGLQSAYSATLVESGDADLDGYITVQDELGSMMQVKGVKGIVLGSTLYSGVDFARGLAGLTGTENGDEFVRSLKERLGITDTSVAQGLIDTAYNDGQLKYVSDSDYSNYIGWYGDSNNGYLGFWDKDTGLVADGAPSGAKYINRSYLYLGSTDHGGTESDMMHIIVLVRTEITTGHQTVLFKVPSSLIPMVEYKVELEGDSLETATDISLTVEETDPIRLLYEVGLPADVNNINIEKKVEEYLAKGGNHIHKDADGNYVFFANSWDDNHDDVAPDIANMTDAQKAVLTEHIAESHFIPNTANERFYIQEDTPVYTKNGDTYTKVTSRPAVGTDYYFARTIVTIVNGTAKAVTQYEKLYDATVANTARFQQNAEGYWEVKAGTPRQSLSALGLPKNPNATDTIANSDHLWVYIAGTAAKDHNIVSFLGNNGKLMVKPATGLKVTKDVTELADGASADEKFQINVLLDWTYSNENVAALAVTDVDGNVLDNSVYVVSESQGKIQVTVNLADGESAYITGVPAGTTYTVTEAAHDKYSYTHAGATQTVAGTIVEGVVTNQPIQPGALYITKEVVHAHGGETFPTDHEFEFEVTFVDKSGDPIANTEFQLENNYDANITARSTDENGVMIGWLRHGETVYIKGIPAGATVTVEEVNLPQDGNYTLKSYRSRNHSGADADNDGVVTIESLQNATVVVTNTYTPKATTVDLDIAGTKIFDAEGNENILPGGGFTFKVQKWNGQAWEDVDGKSARVEYAAKEDGTKTFTIDNVLQNITYTEAGTYTYQVLEVIGSVANVTYDRTLYTFTVTVTDNNGQLVATVTDLNNVEITDGSYEVTFENTFHTAPVSIDIAKEVENKSGSPEISKAGFKFVAKEAEVIEGVWSVKNGGKTLEVYSDGAGEARVTATYKEQGTHYYIVTEVGDGKNGWTYSDAEYHVTVEVTDDGTGDLSAALTIVAVDGTTAEGESAVANGNSGKIIFKNTYDPTDAELGLSTLVKKNLEGRDLVAGEFSFAIFENGEAQFNQDGNLTNIRDAVATGTNDASGNVTFTPEKLTFSEVGKYEYDIVEVKGNKGGVTYDPIIYDLVVEVADNGDGTLKATYYFEDSVSEQVTFENTYTVKGTEVVIDGIKTLQVLSGSKALHAGDYTFYLYNEDGNKIGETTNLANGTFKFDAIKYTGADIGKTYKYTVKEANAGTTVNGVTYSSQTFTVTVKVIDNGDGTLRTEVTGNGTANIKFVNEYTSELADVTLEGKKNLQNRDLTAGEFKFALYQADKNFENLVLVDDTITHDADGKFTVSINDLDAGYHFYVLKEVIPDTRAPGIHYYGGQYNITIHVTDSGNGQMTYTKTVVNPGVANPADTAIVFNNLYRPEPGELILSGSKTYLGGKTLEDDVFSVGLYEGTNLLQTADVKADKTFTFQALEYTADDVGKTYTYTVKEIIPNGAADNGNGTFTSGNDIYDGTIYTVVVTITDTDKDGALEITKTVNGTVDGPISFTNTFVPDPIQHSLQAKKTYEKGLKGGDFEFRLVSTDGKTNVDQTKENAANGDILFDPITFSAAGEYKFKLTEKKEGILSFIRPSEAEYEITVTVVNENGVLRVSNVAVVNIKNTGESNLEFINTYVMADEDEVILKGTKTLIGDRTTVNDKEFQFGLYDENGDLVETVWNDGNGDFQFSALKFTEKDVAVNGETVVTYTVKEIAGDNARYDYDDTIYTVVITIKDDDKGGIDVSYTVNNVANGAITFENTYTNPTPVTYTPVAKKNYNKPLTGGEFKFKLEGSIGNVTVSDEKTNAAGGIITFNTLSFPEVGTYTFKVTEIDKILGFIEYSAAEYEIVVKVIDTKGVLSIESVTINNDPNGTIEFTNTYKIDGEDEITLRGTKTLTGDRTTVKAGEFEFGLYDENGELVEKVSVKADGTFEFSTLKFDETDVPVGGSKQITYTVKEIAGSDPCMTYDETVYTVVVTVEDNGQGGVKVSYTVNGKADGKLAFTNTYTAPEDVVTNIYIQKKVNNKSEKGIGPDGFKFVLEFGDEELVDTSDKDGKAAFQITFGADDIGKTYEFKVYEKRGNTAGVTYDKTVYTVEVQVLQNPDGSIKTVINGKDTDAIALEFTNIYEKPVTPVTGDDFPIIALGSLLVISGAAMVVLMLTKKNKGGKYLA